MAKNDKHSQGGGDNAAPPKTDAELNEVIKANKKRATVGYIISAIGIISLICAACFFNVILIVIAIIIFGIGYYFVHSAREAIKRDMTEAAIVPALKEVFDNVSYDPEGHIPENVIHGTDMGFDFRIDKIYGSDHIKAEYKGVNIEMSDISLVTVTETIDDDGDIDRSETKGFEGLWLICDFRKRFTADLLLREREGIADKLFKSGIKTENGAFNKQFFITSESEHDVFYILTPHMMEYIQAMDKRANGRTYMRFKKEGKLILALDTGRDFFEVNKLRKASVESLRRQFISEVKYVTDLIDELKLVRTLHEKPTKGWGERF